MYIYIYIYIYTAQLSTSGQTQGSQSVGLEQQLNTQQTHKTQTTINKLTTSKHNEVNQSGLNKSRTRPAAGRWRPRAKPGSPSERREKRSGRPPPGIRERELATTSTTTTTTTNPTSTTTNNNNNNSKRDGKNPGAGGPFCAAPDFDGSLALPAEALGAGRNKRRRPPPGAAANLRAKILDVRV